MKIYSYSNSYEKFTDLISSFKSNKNKFKILSTFFYENNDLVDSADGLYDLNDIKNLFNISKNEIIKFLNNDCEKSIHSIDIESSYNFENIRDYIVDDTIFFGINTTIMTNEIYPNDLYQILESISYIASTEFNPDYYEIDIHII